MARIRWDNTEFYATPIEETAPGIWLMEAKQHSPRTSPGTQIIVKQSEIIEMAAAEMPPDAGLGELHRAMAEERKTLPAPQELIAAHQKKIAESKPPPTNE